MFRKMISLEHQHFDVTANYLNIYIFFVVINYFIASPGPQYTDDDDDSPIEP